MAKRLVSCDIETVCGVKDCPDYGTEGKCGHAVSHKLNKISIIGVWDGEHYYNFKDDVVKFDTLKKRFDWEFVFHNGKFDYKTLKEKGSKITLKDYVGDTNLLGVAVSNRIPEDYLEWYGEERKELNEQLPVGQRHRVGTPLSLKTMAPYYLGIEPFWENPATHDDPEYNKKDCIYTYDLHEYLLQEAEHERTDKFYYDYLMPWIKLIIEAEMEGIWVDVEELKSMYIKALQDLNVIENEVHKTLKKCYDKYRTEQVLALTKESNQKCKKFLETRIKDPKKHEAVIQRYANSLKKKVDALPKNFNLASNPQMLYILQWAGIDTQIDKKNLKSGDWEEADAANKLVLKRAKVMNGNTFASVLLKYREKETEVSYLKQYLNALVGNRIYCNFNLTGTRTHRLSSSGPNLQNVKGPLRKPFKFADPEEYYIYTVDASQIEPRLIAYLTGDEDMVTLFQEGRDYHNYATHLFFEETRSTPEDQIKEKFKDLRNDVAKHGDLSLLYGTGAPTLQNMILTRGERWFELEWLEKKCDEFRSGVSGVIAWKIGYENHYKRVKRVYNDFGAPVIPGRNLKMTLFNGRVQGQASQMIFNGSLMAYRKLWKNDCRPLCWVHDEVIWRIPKKHGLEWAQEQVKVIDKYMTCYKLETPYGRVPLKCEGKLGNSWEH